MRALLKPAAAALTIVGALVMCSTPGEAHKPITSRFTYNAEVFPVLLNRCGHCHIAGGVGPMSLVTYEDAFPWSESLRVELLDAGSASEEGRDDFVKAAHRELSARELDVVLDWAVGGNPEGDPAKRPAPVTLRNDWAGSKPDLELRPADAFEVPANVMDVTQEFVLPTRLDRAREISAIDLLPGTPAVVRDATIAVRPAGMPSKAVGTWIPRQVPTAMALQPGTTLPAGADIVLRIHYKKTWKYEGEAMTDRSAVGLYFTGR